MFHLTFFITLSLVGCFDIICTNFILCVFCKSQCHHFYVEMIAQPIKPRNEFFPVSFKSFENRVFFMISNFIFQLFQHMGHLRVAYHQALQLIFIFDWPCFTYISFHNLFQLFMTLVGSCEILWAFCSRNYNTSTYKLIVGFRVDRSWCCKTMSMYLYHPSCMTVMASSKNES